MVIDLYFTIILLITTVSVLLQCYLLFMLIYASPKSMVTYKYYLCVISVWDLLFAALLGYGLHPKVLFPYGCASVNGFFQYFGQTGAKVGMSMVLFTAVCVIMAEVNCLLYRMTVILSDQRIHEWYLKPVCVIFIQIVILGMASAYGIRLFDIFLDGQQIPEWLQRYSLVWPVPPPSNDTILLAIEFDPAFTKTHSRASALTTTIGICTLELLCGSMTFFIIRTLRKTAHMYSRKTYKLQIQLTLLLLAQLASPVVFFLIPVVYAMGCGLIDCGTNNSLTGEIGMIMITLYALSNPLLTISFVTPYRSYTRGKLGSICIPFGTRIRHSMPKERSHSDIRVIRSNSTSVQNTVI
ncbi:serpentine type 7TM GPCR chemoreceptor srh domain-containing protein [Ditylenchus destructor]|uniref:Serpentine type 7TM GPCR chemoreceptor srh domain-containing protein n=1 Tax=Ditylenchus destructor TaxID=166010 RepID=A0AAD4MGX0_9BILA|nr:serpentine type 7TM GPCR chemoreceptor srh domain-containing protein [Ditylenchus destructor]